MMAIQTFHGLIVRSERGPCLLDNEGVTWRLQSRFALDLPDGHNVQLRGALTDAATIEVSHAAIHPDREPGL